MMTSSRSPTVSATIETPLFTVETATYETPRPSDFTMVEDRHVVALQRQRLQTFSTGRFVGPVPGGEYENIGRLLVVPQNRLLAIRAEGGITESVRCLFTPATLQALTGQTDLVSDDNINACLDVRSPTIARMLIQLADEIEHPGSNAGRLVDALGTAVVIELVRYLAAHRRDVSLRRGGLSRRAYRQIVEYSEGHEGGVSLADLSVLTGYSQRHLTRAFKQSTGRTIQEYIGDLRLKRAMMLLSNGQTPVKDVAVALGYRSVSAFCAAFARGTGESPGHFRKRLGAVSVSAVRGGVAKLADAMSVPGSHEGLEDEVWRLN